jgi:ApbE superfamily uncharacterized protein (UPF0280 family)
MPRVDGESIPNIVRKHFEFKQTAVTIVTEESLMPIAETAIFDARETIERFILREPLFATTLEPYEPAPDAHPVIRHMCDATKKAGVGPMASVAGAIAEAAVKALVKAGARHAIVDNGGDIALYLSAPVDIGIFTLNPKFQNVGFRVERLGEVFGICTSSGTVGPSISFGKADAATVISGDVTLADACATRLGNAVKEGTESELEMALADVMDIDGVEGAMVIVADRLAMKGSVPRLVKVRTPVHSISKIELPGGLERRPAHKSE